MRFNEHTLKWILRAIAVIVVINLIPWGFVFKILLILGVIWLALNLNGNAPKFSADESDDDDDPIPARPAEDERFTRRFVCTSGVIDLTDSGRLPDHLTVQTTLSSVTVRLPVDAGITVHTSGVLCSISLPNRQSIMAGKSTHHFGTQDPRAPRLYLECSCLLSSVRFEMG